MNLVSTVEQRLYGVTPEGASFMRVYVALQLLGTVVEFATGAKDKSILVHHLSSVAAYVSILCNKYGAFYIPCVSACACVR